MNTNIGDIKNKVFMFVIGQCHRVLFLRTLVYKKALGDMLFVFSYFVCRVIIEAEGYEMADLNRNKMLALQGAEHILARYPGKSLRILTHGNTGSLATAGYGTALGRAT